MSTKFKNVPFGTEVPTITNKSIELKDFTVDFTGASVCGLTTYEGPAWTPPYESTNGGWSTVDCVNLNGGLSICNKGFVVYRPNEEDGSLSSTTCICGSAYVKFLSGKFSFESGTDLIANTGLYLDTGGALYLGSSGSLNASCGATQYSFSGEDFAVLRTLIDNAKSGGGGDVPTTTVSTSDGLKTALADAVAAGGEQKIEITSSLSTGEQLTISGTGSDSTKITLDLAEGQTVTFPAGTTKGIVVDHATLVLSGNGTFTQTGTTKMINGGEDAVIIVNGGTVENTSAESSGTIRADTATSTLTINGGTFKTAGRFGVLAENGGKIIVNGGSFVTTYESTDNSAYAILAKDSSSSVVISADSNATIYNKNYFKGYDYDGTYKEGHEVADVIKGYVLDTGATLEGSYADEPSSYKVVKSA